jgi:hypothetical protein
MDEESNQTEHEKNGSPSTPVGATPQAVPTSSAKEHRISIAEYIQIIQTAVLIVTLIVLIVATREQVRSERFLSVSTEQQVRSTRQLLTPSLGATWEEYNTGPDHVFLRIVVTNYSDFPVYIRGFNIHFPKTGGWPQAVGTGVHHIAPKGTDVLVSFGMSRTDLSAAIPSAFTWPIEVNVATATGYTWVATFKNAGGPFPMIFESIKEQQ